VRAPNERAPHRKMRRWLPGVCRRSASFFYLFLESLIGRNGRNGRPKDRPHPCPFLGPDRFRLGRDHNFASARSVLYRAPKTRAPMRVARTGALAMKLCRRWRKKVRRATDFTASCRECARNTRAPGAGFPRRRPRAPGNPAGRRRAPTARARRRRRISGRACREGTGGAPG
jgi:hypothetical protein